MIEGLSHITFIVRDLDRMEEILVSVLGARKVYDSGDNTFSRSRERFLLAGEESSPIWLAIMKGESLPTRTYNHVAFKISEADYPACLERVQALGLEVREGRSRGTSCAAGWHRGLAWRRRCVGCVSGRDLKRKSRSRELGEAGFQM
jgi:catechol 2,3-dioxygenase-like lactoylglutathione lyase family enzyme